MISWSIGYGAEQCKVRYVPVFDFGILTFPFHPSYIEWGNFTRRQRQFAGHEDCMDKGTTIYYETEYWYRGKKP